MPDITSRERVLNSIEHKTADRVPIDLGMHFSTGISAFAYRHLREYLGLSIDNIEIVDPIQFLARVDDDILQRFHCDCILLHPGFSETYRWSPRTGYEFTIPSTMQPHQDSERNWIVDRNGAALRMPQGGYFFDGGWPSFGGDDFFERTAREAERIYKETEYFTTFMELGAFFSRDVDYLCDMLTAPDEIKRLHERQLEGNLRYAGKIIDRMGGYIQAIALNSDLGTQNGPMCNPVVYESLVAPYLKELCDFIHRNSDLKIFMHTCGSIKPFIPILIECGVDIVNPVQISARNMDPKDLKNLYGDKITFWGGGCNTQAVLNMGNPLDVELNVKELISAFKPGGGFIFNQVHNIMGDIKPENIVTMLDTAYNESFY